MIFGKTVEAKGQAIDLFAVIQRGAAMVEAPEGPSVFAIQKAYNA